MIKAHAALFGLSVILTCCTTITETATPSGAAQITPPTRYARSIPSFATPTISFAITPPLTSASSAAPTAKATGAPIARQTQTPTSPGFGSVVDRVVERAIDEFGLVGITIGFRRGDELPVVKGYGHADLGGSAPADPFAIYPIASLTKQFTAAAIMQLAEAGKLSVDDPITRFTTNAPTAWEDISLRHLLNHTSGIPNYDAALLSLLDLFSEYTVEEVVWLIKDWAPLPAQAPGSRFEYSSVGYDLLGAAIENASGLSYGAYLQEHVIAPLRLEATGFELTFPPAMAQGHAVAQGELQPVPPFHPSLSFAAGGIVSTARDLLEWQRALEQGRVVSPESYHEMITPTSLTTGDLVPYGYGLFVGTMGCVDAVYHSGRANGHESYLIYCPDRDVGLVLLLNSRTDDPAVTESLVLRLIEVIVGVTP